MNRSARKNGYHLKTFQLYEKADDLQKYIEELRISQCAGVILLGTEVSASVCREFLQLSVPVVLLDSYFDSADCSCVLSNNAQGAYLATGYLIDRCGRQPGHLCSSYRITNFRERTHGFHRAVREHGMSTAKSIIHELSPSIEGAFSDMLEIIDSGTPLAGAYFADNDLIAIGAIKALKLRGYKVPEDIAIAGFDNISEGRVIDPALTTIDVPRKFMGQTAAAQLIRELKTPVPHSVKIEVSTTLIKRFSVCFLYKKMEPGSSKTSARFVPYHSTVKSAFHILLCNILKSTPYKSYKPSPDPIPRNYLPSTCPGSPAQNP